MIEIHCAYDAMVPLSELKPNPKNRNRHSPEQIQRLAEIIKYNGVRRPITVSKLSGVISVGGGRLEAAKILKMESYPVNFQDYKDSDAEYADSIADNAIARWSDLDFPGINLDMQDLGPDLNIEMLGLKNFVIDPSDKMVETVNHGDENSEWVGMPEFEPGEKYIRLIFHFGTELERDLYCQKNKISPDKKMNGQWIVNA